MIHFCKVSVCVPSSYESLRRFLILEAEMKPNQCTAVRVNGGKNEVEIYSQNSTHLLASLLHDDLISNIL